MKDLTLSSLFKKFVGQRLQVFLRDCEPVTGVCLGEEEREVQGPSAGGEEVRVDREPET